MGRWIGQVGGYELLPPICLLVYSLTAVNLFKVSCILAVFPRLKSQVSLCLIPFLTCSFFFNCFSFVYSVTTLSLTPPPHPLVSSPPTIEIKFTSLLNYAYSFLCFSESLFLYFLLASSLFLLLCLFLFPIVVSLSACFNLFYAGDY